MASGKPRRKQQDLRVATCDLPRLPGHLFYSKLNRLPDESGFDRFVEDLCKSSHTNRGGRSSLPPVVDSTLIEANAAMKSIVGRDTGGDWKELVRQLMVDEGIEDPTFGQRRYVIKVLAWRPLANHRTK